MIWRIIAYLAIGLVCGICTTAFCLSRDSDYEDATSFGFIVTFMWACIPIVLLIYAVVYVLQILYIKMADWLLGLIKKKGKE